MVRHEYLGGLGDVLVVVHIGVGIPGPRDIPHFLNEGATITWHPFVSNFYNVTLVGHRQLVTMGYDFVRYEVSS